MQRTATEKMKIWADAPRKCKALNDELQQYIVLINAARGLTAVKSDGMPKSPSPSNPTEMQAGMAMALAEEYGVVIQSIRERLSSIFLIKNEVDAALARLTPLHEKVAQMKYIEEKSWARLSIELNYAESHLKKVHGEILRMLHENDKK